MLVINSIDKSRLSADSFSYSGNGVAWKARLVLFLGFALLAGGLAGSVVVLVMKYIVPGYVWPTIWMGVGNVVANALIMLRYVGLCELSWTSANVLQLGSPLDRAEHGGRVYVQSGALRAFSGRAMSARMACLAKWKAVHRARTITIADAQGRCLFVAVCIHLERFYDTGTTRGYVSYWRFELRIFPGVSHPRACPLPNINNMTVQERSKYITNTSSKSLHQRLVHTRAA